MCEKVQADPYVPKKIKVMTPEEEKEAAANPQPAPVEEVDEDTVEALTKELDALAGNIDKKSINAAEFEKDDDTNFHIEFINANAHPMNTPSTAPKANKSFLFGDDGSNGGVAYSKTINVSG